MPTGDYPPPCLIHRWGPCRCSALQGGTYDQAAKEEVEQLKKVIQELKDRIDKQDDRMDELQRELQNHERSGWHSTNNE